MRNCWIIVLALLFFGCAGQSGNVQKDVQDQIKDRPNACNSLKEGESTLCAAAERLNLNLTDLGKMSKLAVPTGIWLAYRDDPEKMREAIDKTRIAIVELRNYLNTGELTGADLFKYVSIRKERDRIFALFIYAGMQEFFETPEMLLPLTEWDKKELDKWLVGVDSQLLFLRGGIS